MGFYKLDEGDRKDVFLLPVSYRRKKI